jgi:hypothetical protein
MKFKEKRKKLYLEIFDHHIEMIFSNDTCRTFHKQAAKDEWTNDQHDPFIAMHICFGNKSTLIFPYDATPDVIAHECFHIVFGLFVEIGAEFNNEIMAYLLGYLVLEAHKLKNRKKKSKKSLTAPKGHDSLVMIEEERA